MGTIGKGRALARGSGKRRALSALVLAAAGSSIALLATGAAAAATRAGSGPLARGASANAVKVKGGTAYFAEGPEAAPNYIFPFQTIAFFSVTNLSQFQFLMFRPLYWFGTGNQPTLNPSLSLASEPTYSNKNTSLSFTLKPYRWSDGETVTAKDVLFWMNMLKVEKLNWAAYAPGTMPDDIKSIVVDSPTKITFNLTGSVNSYWYTYNELSQITPMPMAWDITKVGQKSGSQACANASYQQVTVKTVKGQVQPVSPAAKSCAAVWAFLSRQAGYDPTNPKAPNNSLSTYATNPLWQVVDGPWHLVSFNTTGYAAFAPNKSYSGPVKPTLSKFVELPFTSTGAEFNALVGGKLTVGYLPTEDVTAPAKSPLVPGPNNPRLSNFTIAPQYSWGINYFPYNFNSTGDNGQAGKIFRQLYFRQAFQSLVDQPLYIKKLAKNYAVPTYGPVPVLPKNQFASAFTSKNPYPYNVAKAVSLLRSHGWDVKPGGVTTCSDAAKCGVPAGTPLQFNLQYVNSGPYENSLMLAEQASWAQAGIKINLTSATFDTIIGNAIPCSGKNCTWELENWGGGWNYAPDYYPTGEEIFQTGAGSNVGSYSNKRNDELIHATNYYTSPKWLTEWQNYFALQSPVVWQPNVAFEIVEVNKSLKGALPVNPLLTINPENWYFTK